MNKKKSLYEAPTIDILEVQFEGAILTNRTDTLSINYWQDGDTELDF